MIKLKDAHLNRSRGFTLMELLIGMIIVAIRKECPPLAECGPACDLVEAFADGERKAAAIVRERLDRAVV